SRPHHHRRRRRRARAHHHGRQHRQYRDPAAQPRHPLVHQVLTAMNVTKPAYQLDAAGLFVCTTEADESPLEPGVWHMPAGTIDTPPPDEWPSDKWPRWNGHAWQLVPRPAASAARPEPS